MLALGIFLTAAASAALLVFGAGVAVLCFLQALFDCGFCGIHLAAV